MAYVHPERHLGLLAVAAERAFSDQQPDDYTPLEVGQWTHGARSTAVAVSPSRKT
jgi:hypothetical protein